MAWQLVAGISHELKPGVDLVLNYRYFNTDGPNIIENEAGIIHNDSWDDVGQHTLTIGLRFDLTPGI
jgi:opacity protein-like surface antigen